MAKVKDFATSRVSGPEEWKVIREAYAETYPVRPLLNHVDELKALLREYMAEFPAFRAKPVGSPHSEARKEQQADIAREDRARAAIDGGANDAT